MRQAIIAANWKMYKTDPETKAFIQDLAKRVADVTDREIMVIPSFVSLRTASEAAGKNITIGAQNMYPEDSGAFTGEVSPLMIKEFCSLVLIGHSERRWVFHENDSMINKKIRKALSSGLKVVFCVGERIEEREAGKTYDVLKEQLERGLESVDSLNDVVIAYEPVWAIGTGRTATPEIAQQAHSFIRDKIAQMYGEKAAESVRIIYGGSVKPENIKDLMAQEDIDGGLVGGASLDLDSFEKIIRY